MGGEDRGDGKVRQKGWRDEVKVEEEEGGKGLGRREGGGTTDVLCTACAHALGSLTRVAAPHKWHLKQGWHS